MPPSTRLDIPPDHPKSAWLTAQHRQAATRANLAPGDGTAWESLAALALEAGQAEVALAWAGEAERLARRSARAAYLCGRALRALGDPARAVEAYRRALRLQPTLTDGWISLASAYRALHDFDRAAEAAARAHELEPLRAELWVNAGNLQVARSDHDGALRAFSRALELEPGNPAALLGTGHALMLGGRYADALEALDEARPSGHQPVDVQRFRGHCLHLLGRFAEARAAWAEAWTAALADPRLRPNLFNQLIIGCEDPEAGLPVVREARAREPGELLLELFETDILIMAQRLGEAGERLDRLWEAHAGDARILFSGVLYAARTRDPARARAWLARALAFLQSSDVPGLGYPTAAGLLRLGEFREGWRLFEQRTLGAGVKGRASLLGRALPLWKGGAAPGKRLLVWQEQGLGDAIQMLRFVPGLAGRFGFAAVELLVTLPLERLLAAQPDAPRVHSQRPPQHVDLQLPDMSLPARCLTAVDELAELPAPYLQAAAADLQRWRERLPPAQERRRVALVWAGNPNQDEDRFRSVPVADLAPLAQVPGIDWFTVQKGQIAAEFSGPLPVPTTDLGPELRDLADTAAILTCMDLVITVDSAPAHLAGALGRPVWLLNRASSEYRWMLDREDSPWYPSLRIFNQAEPRRWRPTLEGVAEALAAWAGTGQAGSGR